MNVLFSRNIYNSSINNIRMVYMYDINKEIIQ